MMRIATAIGLFLCLLLPLDAAAFWLADGQCADTSAGPVVALDHSAAADPEDCTSQNDPTDPSFNACFELAEHPISTLPELIAQSQAESVVAALLQTSEALRLDAVEPLVPSPTEASVEDPEVPGRQLIARPPVPRPRPNSCAVYPDDCENAPVIPTLNLEASAPSAHDPATELGVEPAPAPESRRGPPSPGVAPAQGVVSRLDRPPQPR